MGTLCLLSPSFYTGAWLGNIFEQQLPGSPTLARPAEVLKADTGSPPGNLSLLEQKARQAFCSLLGKPSESGASAWENLRTGFAKGVWTEGE